MKYILSIDQGTTGTTAALIDANTFEFVSKSNTEFPQIFPKPSWVEHDLNDIWKTVEVTITDVLNKCKAEAKDILAIGITNQRETTCAFNKKGEPLANAIVWQDRRTSSYCEDLKSNGLESKVKQLTGLPLDPYFSGTKMNWLLENNEKVKNAATENDLLFGNIDTFLLYKLTGAKIHATEASNASRTLLMNLETTDWDHSLLDIFKVKKDYLPSIQDSFSDFGKTEGLSFLPDGISISGILGDQQSALFGQAGFKSGDMKCTYGTGAFMLLNTGSEIKRSNSGLLSTVAFKHKGKASYALEGSCYIAGAAVQWLRDNLNIIDTSPDIEKLANSVNSLEEMEHILFLPYFSGIGSPHWKAEAKAAIIGITRDTSKSHLAKACLDGIALSINDLVQAMADDTQLTLSELKVDGGAVANNLLMNTQATISKLKIIRPKVIETTAYGAALAAAIGLELIDFEKINDLWKKESEFTPTEDLISFYENKSLQWTNVVKKLFL
jgi:glycerol kinase